MKQIEEAIEILGNEIRGSAEYKRYQEKKERLHHLPELEKQVMEYRRKNFELQNSQNAAGLYEATAQFEQEYREFRKNPYVSEYLAAELAICRIVQQINWTLIEGLDFEVGFVE